MQSSPRFAGPPQRLFPRRAATNLVHWRSKSIIVHSGVALNRQLFSRTALAELSDTLEARVEERTAEMEPSEAALRAADKQKDEFIAVLAHELRNPLAPLRTGIDTLLHFETPLAGDGDRRKTTEAGVDHHFVKPVAPQELEPVSPAIRGRQEGLVQRPVDQAGRR